MPTLYGEEHALLPRATGDLCTVINQATAIVGGKLFYAAGTYTFTDGNVQIRQRKLFSIDLSNPVTAHTTIKSNIYKSIDTPSGFPVNSDAGIGIYTNTTIYFYDPSISNSKIWTYNADTEEFKEITVADDQNVPEQIYAGGWASDPATGMMYYTGSYRNSQKKRKRSWGWLTGGKEEENVLERRAPTRPWMQVLDASEGDDKAKWLEGAGRGPTLLYGTLQYVRYGKKGILVGFGGVDPDDHSQFADPNVGSYRDMRDIFVFDIDSQRWFTIQATGGNGIRDIPDGRLSFCSGVSAAPDDSSFQITIYGGYKLSNVAATNRVHVLILPTFQWLDVTPSDQRLGDDRWGRQTNKCAMWNDAQMIVFGGQIQGNNARNNTPVNTGACNATHPPLVVLDTTVFEWTDEFNPNRSYSQPKQVYELIGGDWRGLAGRKEPPNGFDNTLLEDIFATTVQRIDQPTAFSATSPSPSTSTSAGTNPNNNNDSEPSGPNTAAIAGGVVGGVLGIALIVGLIWFFFIRKRQPEEEDMPSIPLATGIAPTGRHQMMRYEKPELDGSQQPLQAQAGATGNGEAFDPLKQNAQPGNEMAMELPGDERLRPGLERALSNGRSVYELDSGETRGELPGSR
ncbi:hypothetical protein TWF106_002862 [Orbilia oligospora]|uniref:Kelch repeat protein n=1 Tax=Orbilia oligospora TaxID=2813651 RepID=A0A6G1LYZ8_ORBOL|nr:hypothetical protein TWF788_006968 [Orbilia oligospora]KAF3201323.1 hypothetical protein TWF106_002862 [Orbilia oligospora]KAF3218019.1 hypothetical protein TWF679_001431 [Orbilia oligospora]KAF3218691.1 hypothetical protein TWF191_008137 [Orbilia oligospora]KAF3239239.1 hypothetical protein TWF192_010114 [Orbilia oligospora]